MLLERVYDPDLAHASNLVGRPLAPRGAGRVVRSAAGVRLSVRVG